MKLNPVCWRGIHAQVTPPPMDLNNHRELEQLLLILTSGSCGDQFQFIEPESFLLQINRLAVLFLLSLRLNHSSTQHQVVSVTI